MPFKSGAECAYVAGLFEGEGTFHVARFYYIHGEKRPRRTPQFHLRIAMSDKEPLERVAAYLKGGYINGPYRYGKAHFKQYWTLSIDSPPLVRAVIRAMWSYLSPRRQKQLEVGYSI